MPAKRSALSKELRKLMEEEGMSMPQTTTESSSDITPTTHTHTDTADGSHLQDDEGTAEPIPIQSKRLPSAHHRDGARGCVTNRFESLLEESADREADCLRRKGVLDEQMVVAGGAASASSNASTLQKFKLLLVIDFEATCDDGEPNFPHEIIEFPIVVVDTRSRSVVAEFHSYVRPKNNPQLTPFCTALTGITQKMVDEAPYLPEVVQLASDWLCSVVSPLLGPGGESSSTTAATLNDLEKHAVVATDGPWDMRKFMYECAVLRDGIAFPKIYYRWVNIRRSFADHFHMRPEKLTKMLKRCGMVFHGQHHSGIDDARNIARIAIYLMKKGCRISHASSIPFGDLSTMETDRARIELLELYGDDDHADDRRHSRRDHRSAGGRSGKNPKSK